jgi:hypothetical protein
MNLALEALSVGVVTLLFGMIITAFILLIIYIFDNKFGFYDTSFWILLPISYFLTGISIHLIFEYTGLNKSYCENGNACRTQNVNNIK